MYQALIERIAVLCRQYHQGDIQPPATEEALTHLLQRTREEFGADLPQQYLDFLRVTDGLNWDGLFIYASASSLVAKNPAILMHSFVEDNLDWRSDEHWNDYLVFADSDMNLYALNLAAGRYEFQDRYCGNVISSFGTFNALITEAFRLCLHEDEDDGG